tara:strand:- start:605 stop:955 length:351 start_codon:yes stop_codon:yes gene_type:complete
MAIYYINRIRLNTDTSIKIAEYWNGLPNNDFKHCSENLYLSPKGTWFLVGGGGPMSRWAHHNTDGTRGTGVGCKILTKEEAYDWLEEKELSFDETVDGRSLDEIVETYFSDIVSDG